MDIKLLLCRAVVAVADRGRRVPALAADYAGPVRRCMHEFLCVSASRFL